MREKSSISIRNVSGYIIAAAGLIWVLHDADSGQLWNSMISVNWSWISVAIIFDILSYLCQGIRWKFLLEPLGSISVFKTTQAIYTGLFANEIIPLRFGELVRSYLVSRWMKVQFISVIPSLFAERLFDGIWISLGTGIIAIFLPLPKDLLRAGDILGIIVVVASGIFAYFAFGKKDLMEKSVSGIFNNKTFLHIKPFLEKLFDGIRSVGKSQSLHFSFLFSFLVLFFQILAFWFVMIAYGMNISFWIGAAVLLIVHLGTAIPNAPSNVGTYQFFCVAGLTLFNVDKTTATGFSIAVFILLTIPLWVIGLLALSNSGLSLAAIKSEVGELKKLK